MTDLSPASGQQGIDGDTEFAVVLIQGVGDLNLTTNYAIALASRPE